MNTTIPLMLIFNIQSMSQDGHWADNPIIRATADALNIEIYIISSAQETPTITFKLTIQLKLFF